MRIAVIVVAALFATVSSSAQEAGLVVKLIPGHTIHHEAENEAGVAMLLTITPTEKRDAYLVHLCDELRTAVGLPVQTGEGLRLETLFVVPRKNLVVEGYYWPGDGNEERAALVPGNTVARTALDRIIARAGIPPAVLDQSDVEHEVSCSLDEPLWYIAWNDVRSVGGEHPEAVIAHAKNRFLAIHESVRRHASGDQGVRETRQVIMGGWEFP